MTGKYSPIVTAIAEAESKTTGEIRVHLSRRWFERDPMKSARRIFLKYDLDKTTQRNAVLLYVNLKNKRFAILGDEGIHQRVGQSYWEKIAHELRDQLHSTYFENAIAVAVSQIGIVLKKYFPLSDGNRNDNELSNEVTHD